ncbi:hypothetical protein [Mycolicibacterium frederiksbergense]|uniref:hypothetical protein n=1 Tax=Mycolicibacterium frederiksbergense TaxID=117567 RepID=UPI00399B249F
MGRPHKGERALLQTRPWQEVTAEIKDRQISAGVSCLSQYIADVLALHVGRPELVAELGRAAALPLDQKPAARSGALPSRGPLLQTRPHVEVWSAIHRLTQQAGVRSIRQYVADVLAIHVGRPDLVVDLGQKQELPIEEELPLAI